MPSLRQVLVTPNDSEATSWWLAFSEEGVAPFYVMPTVSPEDAVDAIHAAFNGEVEVPEWTGRMRGDGCYWGDKQGSRVYYRPVEKDATPCPPEVFAAGGLCSHDHEQMVWFNPNMNRRVCALCYGPPSPGGTWVTGGPDD